MGPTWGPPGSCRPQMGPMLAPWTVLSWWVKLCCCRFIVGILLNFCVSLFYHTSLFVHDLWTQSSFKGPCHLPVTCIISSFKHYNDFTLASWHLKSLANWLFVQQLVQDNNNEIKATYYWFFMREIYWWLVESPHKGPVKQKVFPCHDIIMIF